MYVGVCVFVCVSVEKERGLLSGAGVGAVGEFEGGTVGAPVVKVPFWIASTGAPTLNSVRCVVSQAVWDGVDFASFTTTPSVDHRSVAGSHHRHSTFLFATAPESECGSMTVIGWLRPVVT